MIEKETWSQQLKNKLSYFLEEELIEEIIEQGRILEVKEDTVIIEPNQEIATIPIVLDGAIKVSRENENGEELLIYYLESGDTCAMTIQCCVRKRQSEIKATAMSDAVLLSFPIEFMETWMDTYKSWRNFILQSYHTRMMELIETVDALAFKRLDERLLQYLKDQSMVQGSLEILRTHQQIAEDLHSSRVVVSRLLKQLEKSGDITLHRNKIVLKEI